MADFNVNTNQSQSLLAGGMNPSDPSESLYDSMQGNKLKQQEQEQLVQQAVEKTKQAKLGTQQEETLTDTGAYLAEKGLMPKSQAIGELKVLLDKQGMDDDEVSKIVSEAEAQWPDEMDGNGIYRWYSAMRDSKAGKLGEGAAFQADGSQQDSDGKPYPKGTWLQDIVDTNGEHTYVQSSEAPGAIKAEHAGSGADEKTWQKLGAVTEQFTKSSRGQAVMNTITRAKNALDLLHEFGENPPRPILGQIYNDIAGIMTGGVGTDITAKEASYNNILLDLNNKLGYYTGHYSSVSAIWSKMHGGISPLKEILSNLDRTLTSLINVAAETVKAQLQAEEPIFRPLIESNPQRFQDLIDAKMHIIGAGLPTGASASIPAINPQMPTPGAPAPVPGAQQTTPSGVQFTVEGQ